MRTRHHRHRTSETVYLVTAIAGFCLVAAKAESGKSLSYPIAGTGQTKCYDNRQEIQCPAPGRPFYGQDAQHAENPPRYAVSPDGFTVKDATTGLTWQRSPDTNGNGRVTSADKLTWAQAQARPAALNAARFGGFNDWRLPTIKQLYSLMNFSGADPGPYSGTDTSGLQPFIDTKYFQFGYGEPAAGERIIDAQFASSNVYVNKADKVFGLNLADGRIKGYDLNTPRGDEKTLFVLCVRGNPAYGMNKFADNGDGTVNDAATGLMWSKADNGKGLNWEDALAWVQAMNAKNYLGHNDWRMPNAKELQSILDYSRSPDTTHSAAIDPVFSSTGITNELGQPDYPFYWTGTTHVMATGLPMAGGPPGPGMGERRAPPEPSRRHRMGRPDGPPPDGPPPEAPGFAGQGFPAMPPPDGNGAAVYLAFGRGLGFIGGAWRDVHGAGTQRSDPKTGDPSNFPRGRGPQGDAIRINNFVRLVRNAA